MFSNLSNRRYVTVALSLLIVLFLALNIFASTALRQMRLDLTDGKLFTLSDGTTAMLRSIEEPITVKLYYSQSQAVDIQQIRVLGERVKDLLSAFAARSNGKVQVEIIDPLPYTEAEDAAEAVGLSAAPTSSGESIYFGVVASNTIDGQEVIPFLSPDREANLEYDLASMVYRLNRERPPVLGLLTDLPLAFGPGGMMAAMQGQSKPFVLYEQLLASFELEELDPSIDRIPAHIETLLLVHPPALSDTALYALDQFVMRGGRVVAFLDPFSEMSQIQGPSGEAYTFSSAASLGRLMDAWGVDIDGSKIIADRSRALRVGFGQGGLPTDYVIWLGLTTDDFENDDIVTGSLDLLQLASAGSLSPIDGATTDFAPMIRSSTDAMLIDFQEAQFQTPPDQLLRDFAATGERFVIGARITGPVTTIFPDGAPSQESSAIDPETGDELGPLPDPIAATDNANIIVVADSDLFNDQFWVQVSNFLGERLLQETADNASLVVGAAENLMGSNDLISLRSRAPARRSFTRVEAIRRDAEARFLPQQQALDEKLDQIVARVDEIRGSGFGDQPGDDGTLLVTPEQRLELQRLLFEADETRKARRDTQFNLQADIKRLGTWVKFFNIAFMPLVVAGFALVLSLRRRRSAPTSEGAQ